MAPERADCARQAQPGLSSSESALADVFDLALLDLDGVVYRGDIAVDHAVDVLDNTATRMERVFITNNASATPESVADRLRSIGLSEVHTGDIVTSAQAIAHVIANDIGAGTRVLTVGGEGLRSAVAEREMVCIDSAHDDPDAVVQGFDRSIGWQQLAEAAYAVAAGVPWYASNTDPAFPTARGVAPGNGSLVQAVAMATGTQPVVAGKPHRALFDEAMQRRNDEGPTEGALVIGDRLDTDIRGANAAGLASLAVTTGVSDLNVLASARGHDRPRFIGPDLRALLRAHAPVMIDSHATKSMYPESAIARCGRARAWTEDHTICTEGSDIVERYRCAIGLAWHLSDNLDSVSAVPYIDGTLGA